MKKAVKFVLWTLLALMGLAVLLVATLPLWLGPVARPVANRVAPTVTKTDFSLGRLSLNPWTGRLEIGDVLIGNPAGYSEPRAVELGSLTVVLDLPSLLTDRIHVREVTLSDCFVSYLFGGENNVDNVTQIQMNVAGGKEKYEAAKRRQEQEAAEGDEADDAEDPDDDDAPAKRLVIDRLTVSGVRVKLQMLTIPVPPITLTDIGKESDGVTMAELTQQVWAAILKGASSAGDVLKSAAGSVQSGAEAVNDGVKKTTDSVKKILGL